MLIIDEENGTVTARDKDGREATHPMASPEAFRLVSQAWLRVGWDVKHVYSFTWLGRPIIQLPEDMFRLAELIHHVQPDVILETGIAHGGSLVFHASLCKAMGRGRVIGVDIDIRPHNRAAIEAHPLFGFISLIEGSSIAPETLAELRQTLQPDERVLVVLDSNHTKDHVRAELEAYGPLVAPNSYIVACDGIMARVVGGPRTQPDWGWNNPTEAAKDFAAAHPEFVLEEPPFAFNESLITEAERVTYWPGAFLRRVA